MPDIYISSEDEQFVEKVRRHGLENPNMPKWSVLRIALAKSLSMPSTAPEELDNLDGPSKAYDLKQVTWQGQKPDEFGPRDLTDTICALLSLFHEEDLFQDEAKFRSLLQCHIRRGLQEMRSSWRPGHDFFDYLYHEFFADVVTPPTDNDTGDFSGKILAALREIGINAKINDIIQGPRITRYFLYLNDVQHLDKLKKGLDKLCFLLGFSENSLMVRGSSAPRIAGLDIPRPRDTWKTVPASLLQSWISDNKPDKALLTMWPGVDILGDPYAFNLSQCPHLLVSGTTGSGKSVCVHALILSLMLQFSPDDLQICLIDTKRMEFGHYKELPHLFEKKVIADSVEAVEMLQKIVEEMESRSLILEKSKARNIAEGGKISGERLPAIVVVVEELADLIAQTDHEAEKHLVRIAQLARAMGIHLILATQRPDAQILSGQLRSNIPARIALTVQKSSESKIILDQTGAEKLLMGGDMLVKIDPGYEPVRVHGIWINRDDISGYVQKAKKGYTSL